MTVVGIQSEKGFIDVEKRSIDDEEQNKFEQLILFYEKVFNTFVKSFYIYNPDCSLEDIYNFLRNTLRLQDPKLIQKNLINIHTQPVSIKKLYNIDYLPENDIFHQLAKHIKKPTYKHIIKLEVKTISLEGVKDISNILDRLSKTRYIRIWYMVFHTITAE